VINDVTVCIPSIPPRNGMLRRAVASVLAQDMPVALSVFVDREKRGAAYARDKALAGAQTHWVAFLDDDDVLDPCHVRKLLSTAVAHNVGYVWSRFRVGNPMYSAPGEPYGVVTLPGPAPLGARTFE
jgi:glycosyltransferase involved in cell wall biosynthesis